MSYQPTPRPPLAVIRFQLEFMDSEAGDGVYAYAYGTSPLRRTSLWTETNHWHERDSDIKHEPADWVHHIALVALQDRPNSSERLLFGLTGGLGIQEELRFDQ